MKMINPVLCVLQPNLSMLRQKFTIHKLINVTFELSSVSEWLCIKGK